MDKVWSPEGDVFTFLGVCDGIAHVEREDKSKGQPFVEVESDVFAKWKKA
jgi:hypothetical protein